MERFRSKYVNPNVEPPFYVQKYYITIYIITIVIIISYYHNYSVITLILNYYFLYYYHKQLYCVKSNTGVMSLQTQV